MERRDYGVRKERVSSIYAPENLLGNWLLNRVYRRIQRTHSGRAASYNENPKINKNTMMYGCKSWFILLAHLQ
jgi:hypothetical protein